MQMKNKDRLFQVIWQTEAEERLRHPAVRLHGHKRGGRAKMFDTFFSTKGQDGSGLGLWVSLDIVQRHHGILKMRSSQTDQAHGTVFRLFLPSELQPDEAQQT